MKFDIRYTGNNIDVDSVVHAASLDSAFNILFGQSYRTYHIIDMVIDCNNIVLELRVVTTVAVIDAIVEFENGGEKE